MKKAEKTQKEQSLTLQMLLASAILVVLVTLGVYLVKVDAPKRREAAVRDFIREEAERNGLEPSLVKAVIWKESKFRPNMIGSKGELGLMQLMPITIEQWRKDHKLEKAPSRAEVLQPSVNIAIGTWYLAWCGKHWDGYKSKTVLQLAEYNAGRGNVLKRWKPKSPAQEVPISSITFKTTRHYIKDILKKKEYYDAHPEEDHLKDILKNKENE